MRKSISLHTPVLARSFSNYKNLTWIKCHLFNLEKDKHIFLTAQKINSSE